MSGTTGPVDINGYWADRQSHDLYRLTVAMAHSLFPTARSAIDVGSFTSGLICELEWIERRVATDLQSHLVENWRDVKNVEFIAGDAFALQFDEPFDLVLSNQTIEHLEDPPGFIKKLLSIGRGLIISTTYELPVGRIEGHIQDPISLDKFRSWFQCELDAYTICSHPSRSIKHIIGVVRNNHPLAEK